MAIATTTGSTLTGQPTADCYGSKTAAIGVEITRVVPPSSGKRATVTSFGYKTAGTAHNVTVLTTLGDTTVTTDAASGQALITFGVIPTAPDGSAMAAADFVVLQLEDGTWVDHKVSSVSGLIVTMTANLAKKVKAGTRIFFMGAPGTAGDHPDRVFVIPASTTLQFYDGKSGLGSASRTGEPNLVHVDNATAAGTLFGPGYAFI